MAEQNRILLLAHGSSDQRWCDTFEKLARPTLSAIPQSAVAYMELSEPSLEQEVARAARDGVTHVTVLPLFLAAGRHLRRDVPAMLADYRSRYNIEIELAPPIGEDAALGEAIRSVVEKQLTGTTTLDA
ncbi:cobalamin biosynthesis protein CbiX [Tamilnaduibacter salinus]|uniref:Cobalamin biosynthesis protein CbiX n=1 Tax=Tamilnaduibacter salinus TaxID=1484056 RepID=A0A2A2I3H7_9GAMM|nr:CbiX/SirB N-terminal domain-containing protein [Tamilnaduibacter salinus]PAV26269.1 cobalamin biosynthesis protein CbiX [Tamilnaduibacter salinus]